MPLPTIRTQLATDIHADIIADGGATWAPGKPAPDSGFMVSRADAEMAIPLDDFTPAHVENYMATYPLGLAEFYGAWISDGVVYLDVSRNYSDRVTALIAGDVNGQLAIWDVANRVEIPLV